MAVNRRIQRMNKTLMKEFGEIIQREVKDPRLQSMVSILDVSVSSDMRSVKVVVSIFGQKELDNLKTMEALNASAGFISSYAGKELRLKWAPEIQFERSHSIEEGVSMYFKIKELTKDEESSAEEDAGGSKD